MANSLTAIILTYNEELHIERCIKSLDGIVQRIVIVDSYSTDNTVRLAENLGVKVYKNRWVNYSIQFNWALENCDINTDWIWRIDTDEYADFELRQNLQSNLSTINKDITGIYVRRGIVFMGRMLRYGTWSPRWTLKIFRKDAGFCEYKWMDEHIILKYGNKISIEGIQIDENLNNINWWTEKHNTYATREAYDIAISSKKNARENVMKSKFYGSNDERIRWLKKRYSRLPLFLRPFLNFFYRYFFRFGFLDGIQGFIWHVLQGFWYRFLVDVKIYELEKRFRDDPNGLKAFLVENRNKIK